MTNRWRSAAEIVGHLGGRWNGKKARCKCPVREHSSDRTPLAVSQTRDGRVLVFCFAGCDQQTVIAALEAHGLWQGDAVTDPSYPGYLTTRHDGAIDIEERKARDQALAIWDGARPAKGTAVDEYLRGRGIRIPVSSELRYVPNALHSPSKLTFRCMVARISGDDGFCAIQRTYLDAEPPRKAAVTPAKMSRGPMARGAVRLRAVSGDIMGLAEGIETALSASQLYSMPVWATLSAQRLGKVDVPASVRFLHIFGDPGEVGREQAFKAADEHERGGRHVEVYFPGAHFRSSAEADFNSVLQAGAPRI